MKARNKRSRIEQIKPARGEDLLREVDFSSHSLENLLLLSAARRAPSADLRYAALIRLEEIREMTTYLHTVNVSLLRLLAAPRIGPAERNAVTNALMAIPMPRRSRTSVRREQRMKAARKSTRVEQ